MQPCDISDLGALKGTWNQSVRDFQTRNIGEFVTRSTFSGVFKSAWTSACTTDISVKRFRESGIFPLDSFKVLGTLKLEPSKVFFGVHTMGFDNLKVIPNQSVSSTISCSLTPGPCTTASQPSDNLIPTTTQKENIARLVPTTENVEPNIQSTQTVEKCEEVPSGATAFPVP